MAAHRGSLFAVRRCITRPSLLSFLLFRFCFIFNLHIFYNYSQELVVCAHCTFMCVQMVTHRSILDKPNSIQTRIVLSRLLDPYPKEEGRESPLLLAFSRMLNLSCIRGHRDITRVTLVGADHDAWRCLCNAREHCTLLYRVSSSRAKSSPPPPPPPT